MQQRPEHIRTGLRIGGQRASPPRCSDTRARAVNVSDPLTFAVALPGFKYALTNLVMDVGKAGDAASGASSRRALPPRRPS